MSWCKHCKDSGGFFSTSYTCELNDEYIPKSYVDDYCKHYSRTGDCPWYKKYDGRGKSSFCFITTASCLILHKKDDDDILNKLRSFRNNVLQKDEKYANVLKIYDSVGPFIACNLMHDKDKSKKANDIYTKLTKLAKLIDDKDYETAVNNYIIMTLRLVSEYNMQKQYRDLRDNDFGFADGEFDQSVAGHGKRLLK